MSLDLSAPLRAAIVGESSITDELPAYKGSYPVFTRVPVPDDAPYPMIVIPTEVGGGDSDGIDNLQPAVVRDVNVYGRNDPNDPTSYRQVESIADAVWELLHRQRAAITAPAGWSITDVQAARPSPAPVDDEQTAGRRVQVTVRLAKLN